MGPRHLTKSKNRYKSVLWRTQNASRTQAAGNKTTQGIATFFPSQNHEATNYQVITLSLLSLLLLLLLLCVCVRVTFSQELFGNITGTRIFHGRVSFDLFSFPSVSFGFLWFPSVSFGFLWFPLVSFDFFWFGAGRFYSCPLVSFFFLTHLFLPASQHWDRLGPGYCSANLYKLLGWGGYAINPEPRGPPQGRRGRRDAGVGLRGGVRAGCSGVACHHQGWCVIPDFGG